MHDIFVTQIKIYFFLIYDNWHGSNLQNCSKFI